MTSVDLSRTIQPRSDQLNADDLIGGERTVTIVEVRQGSAEQPVNIVTNEYGPSRPYKPGLSMRRVLVEAWGPNGGDYVGRRLTLYRDPDVKFGRDTTGGIRISHMSHIAKPITFALTITRGKRAPFTVQPLPDAPTTPATDLLAAITNAPDMETLRVAWEAAKQAGVNGADDAKNTRKKQLEQQGG